ncbi:DUF6326 family protein [Nocardioides sp.]|uniref:DUF6326 family protein n=1 Tax=Nocardioides sp. TaxID=35761 RepID=UPI0026030486|nr:DUF6326 family protein [Nocardioides sp.]
MTDTLADQPLPVRAKLVAAWTSFMFFYAYVDILNFYKPGAIAEILEGRVHEFELSQTFSVTALGILAVPMYMIVASAALPPAANRVTNLVVASLLVPFTIYNISGGEYLLFYGLGIVLELVLLALVVRWAWTWPRTTTAPDAAPRAAGALR